MPSQKTAPNERIRVRKNSIEISDRSSRQEPLRAGEREDCLARHTSLAGSCQNSRSLLFVVIIESSPALQHIVYVCFDIGRFPILEVVRFIGGRDDLYVGQLCFDHVANYLP